ncbi:MAG: hypothetical protein AVDCRST_MAG77-5902 [uncultured Chloroflexi bacterium]|uniref:Uncharacterized protein n=1 Tax=uncultured Chloroflexota bacterium TaxID=166587 RepID=A0A6J4KHG0_9CHLR|nr:MAG: hypothetical protein AVDCRST_MAG77-5902 [uncultured Chloroflexota bacterium]
MALRFESGDPDRPRGHALLYFRTTDDQVLATYVVVLPIAINPAKYIPPAFAGQLPQGMAAVAATALPPIPEQLGEAGQTAEQALAAVRRLADLRGDDLLDGGVVMPDPERLMLATHEVANEYATGYRQMIEQMPVAAAPVPEVERDPAADEDELRWVLMDERDRIGELAKLTGQLRYAMDGADGGLLRSTVEKMERLGRRLPEKYRIGEFLAGAQRPGAAGRRLAELYIDRCYKLSNEQYETLADLDREIAGLEAT